MKTNISTIYHNKIISLAKEYALKRSLKFDLRSRKKVFNSSFKIYYTISIFLYIRLNKITLNKINFNYNRVHSTILKKFSCKLYKDILNDLEKNEIIIVNNHYSHHKKNGFTKSYLMHRKIINRINESKLKLSYQITSIEVPEKIFKITNLSTVLGSDDFSSSKKLNRYYRTNNSKINLLADSYYNKLEFNDKDLNDYCKDDEFLYNHYYRLLKKLKDEPKFVKGRFYHVFHQFSKDFREKVLRFEGEHIKEIFDVSGSDLHMLCKVLENEKIPDKEILKFQNDVKNDFRKMFGVRKTDGKCTEFVKRAFKVYLNGGDKVHSKIRKNSICWRVDQYMQDHYPTIREYIFTHKSIWLDTMTQEFIVMSQNMFKALRDKYNVKSFTCHDAIYVKENVYINNIKDLFYKSLNLLTDRMNKLDNL